MSKTDRKLAKKAQTKSPNTKILKKSIDDLVKIALDPKQQGNRTLTGSTDMISTSTERKYINITFDDHNAYIKACKLILAAGFDQLPLAWDSKRISVEAAKLLRSNNIPFREVTSIAEIEQLRAETAKNFREYYQK